MDHRKEARHAQKTSNLLKKIMEPAAGQDQITIGDFVKLLGDRGFCLAILVFSLPNSLPMPGIPGFSTITGLPITFIALQMVFGSEALWLPKKIAGKSFSRQSLDRMLSKALPTVERLENLLSPRLLFLTSPLGERCLGLLFVVLSLIIALPIPGGNFLPGISMSLVALAMLERDGIFLLGSLAFSIASIMFMYKVIIGFFGWMSDKLFMFF